MNNNPDKKRLAVPVISSLLLVAFVVGVLCFGGNLGQWFPEETLAAQEAPESDGDVIRLACERLERQRETDAMLRAELESGNYTFENPLVVLDPYGESPLTALILFQTDEPSRIEISIPGDSEDTAAVHSFDTVSSQHVIPVYGLYPDQTNTVIVKQLTEEGQVMAERSVEIRTEPLPEWLDNYIILTEFYQGDYEAGLNYMRGRGKFAFDKNGKVRWFYSNSPNSMLPNSYNYIGHHFVLPEGSCCHEGDVVFFEMDRLGKIYGIYYGAYGVHHEIAALPNGNLLVTGSHGDVEEDFLYEIDTTTGETVQTLDLKTVLQRTRFNAVEDWAHINSVVYDDNDGTIILSSNTQCTVAKITWPDGVIRWLLSTPEEYMPRLQQYLLKPVGEEFEYSYNQHHARILPDYDGNPETIDISLFDNGRTRFDRDKELQRQIAADEIVPPENYSRLVHYRINEKDMTVEQIWQYGKERGEELFSWWSGSTQLLSNGNFMGYFETQNDLTVPDSAISENLVEVHPYKGLVWDAEVFTKSGRGYLQGYRATRLPIYFSDDQEHDIYTEARNLIPQEVLDQHS